MRKYARQLTRNSEEAADLVQETYAKAYAAANFDGQYPFAFLSTIMRNAYYSSRRTHYVRKRGDMPPEWEETAAPEHPEHYQDVQRALAKLTPTDQALLIRRAVGYGPTEFANMKESTVKSATSRARARLRALLQPDANIPHTDVIYPKNEDKM